jgi:hypothetical protein
MPLTSGNEFPHTLIGGVSGATAWSRLPGVLGGNGMSLTDPVACTVRSHPLNSRDEYAGDTKRRSLGSWLSGAGFSLQLRS